ncbi:DUF1015 domain-containing protein [Chloroflexota bacterium]
MAEIRPFRGVRYNQALIEDLSKVVCPPYDIITPQMQQELYHRSEYNFVRLEFNRELPRDTARDNKYARSAAALQQWLEQGILKPDEAPAFYLHDHHFSYQGKEYRRRGIIARVRLEEWDKMVVRPHEGTLSQPKSDRISLLWALQANTSPVLALFEDRGQQIFSVLSSAERSEPIIDLSDVAGEGHRVWAIAEPEAVAEISRSLAEQPLYIADGHHRYESALSYQRERRAGSASGDEEFDFVMMTLVDFTDPGLLILPPHRLLRGVSRTSLSELESELKSFFAIEKLPLSMPGVWQRVDDLLMTPGEPKLVLVGLSAEHLFVLRLSDFEAVSGMMPYFHSEIYKKLDVSIVDHIILENLLGLSGAEEAILAYSYDRLDTVNRVLDQEYQLAFLLSPVRAATIKAIADIGDRMPRKSTYFYPKAPAGLVFYNQF